MENIFIAVVFRQVFRRERIYAFRAQNAGMVKTRYNGILFLDIDGTFVRWSLFLYLVDGLIAAGLFKESVRDYFAKEEQLWRERRGDYDDYLVKAIDAFDRAIDGVPVKKVEQLAEKIVEEYRNLVYTYTRDLIQEKLKAGWYVVALSSSPIEMLIPFGKTWGLHEVFGTRQVKDSGKFTSAKVRFIAKDKDLIARQIMSRHEFKHVPKRNIWGVGDTGGDVSFLKLMGKPICFNPTQGLYKEAKKNGWTVMVERKNVIYKLQ